MRARKRSSPSGQPVLVFDVTSAKTPALFDVSGSVVAGTLALTDDVPAGETRTYVVAPRNGIPSVGAPDVQRDTPDPILDELASLPFGSYDALVVAHDDFAQDAKLLEWKAFREAQGVRVRILRTSDAYDAFNGGLLHYEPIHGLVQAAYRNWGIAYVLLVGDGSEDGADERRSPDRQHCARGHYRRVRFARSFEEWKGCGRRA